MFHDLSDQPTTLEVRQQLVYNTPKALRCHTFHLQILQYPIQVLPCVMAGVSRITNVIFQTI